MKFAEHLAAHITPEWRKQYIEYEKMKEMLYEAQEQAPSLEDMDQATVDRYYAAFKEKFFQFCDQELKKINTFYNEKLAEASRKFATYKSELETQRNQAGWGKSGGGSTMKLLRRRGKRAEAADHTRTVHDFRLAFSEFYLSLILLQNYQTLNFTGFRKILKKHDKRLGTPEGNNWRQAKVETSLFHTSKEVETIILETEGLVTEWLEGGDRARAMKRLRVPPLEQKQNPWTTFRVGLFVGCFTILFLVLAVAGFFVTVSPSVEHVIILYRGPFLVILLGFLIGANQYGWGASGVNHVLIFELDPRNNLTYQQFLELFGFLAVLWTSSLIGFIFSDYLGGTYFLHPLWLVGLLTLFWLNPLPIFNHKARRWLLKVIYRIATAPFQHVAFADFWLADQLNSLARALLDLEFMVCFYASDVSASILLGTAVQGTDYSGNSTASDGSYEMFGEQNATEVTTAIPLGDLLDNSTCLSSQYGIRPIVAMLPAWFRFAQCLRRYYDTRQVFPHLVNAGKYSTTFLVVIMDTLYRHYSGISGKESAPATGLFYALVASLVFSSCYTYTWDIKMDWGLFDSKHSGENRFLREEIVYRYKAYYYFAIIEDFVLRFIWTIGVSFGRLGIGNSEVLTTLFGILEVVRRFIWNYFRLENEHLNNCGNFRAVRDISIAPINQSDQVLLEQMMDQLDGVTNRRVKDGKQKLLKSAEKQWADENEEEETWTVVKGGLTNWLKNKKASWGGGGGSAEGPSTSGALSAI